LIKKLHDAGMTILLVEQNVVQAFKIADRVYLINMGRVEASGTPADLRHSVDVESAALSKAPLIRPRFRNFRMSLSSPG
jgi:branched-chain amino acid transport system ATP-binding protein